MYFFFISSFRRPTFAVPIESPTDVYARPVSSTEALVWWLPVVDTGTGLQQYVEGYQVEKIKINQVASKLRQTVKFLFCFSLSNGS